MDAFGLVWFCGAFQPKLCFTERVSLIAFGESYIGFDGFLCECNAKGLKSAPCNFVEFIMLLVTVSHIHIRHFSSVRLLCLYFNIHIHIAFIGTHPFIHVLMVIFIFTCHLLCCKPPSRMNASLCRHGPAHVLALCVCVCVFEFIMINLVFLLFIHQRRFKSTFTVILPHTAELHVVSHEPESRSSATIMPHVKISPVQCNHS